MKPSCFLAGVFGFFIGACFVTVLMTMLGTRPRDYTNAAKPLYVARGMNDARWSTDLATALNPCIVIGELPEECKRFVKNGVVTQPPIRIIVDTSK